MNEQIQQWVQKESDKRYPDDQSFHPIVRTVQFDKNAAYASGLTKGLLEIMPEFIEWYEKNGWFRYSHDQYDCDNNDKSRYWTFNELLTIFLNQYINQKQQQ